MIFTFLISEGLLLYFDEPAKARDLTFSVKTLHSFLSILR